jgi:hypothetical protein
MDIMICPLEPAWGTWGEWFAGAASLGVGIAIYRLTRRTNKLAAAANHTNELMAKHEFDRTEAENELHAEERRLILVYLSTPILLAQVQIEGLCNAAAEPGFDQKLRNQSYRDVLTNIVDAAVQPLPDGLRDRMHIVGNPIAARLLRTQSMPAALKLILEFGTNTEATPKEEMGKAAADLLGTLNGDLSLVRLACIEACRDAGIIATPKATSS